MGACFLEIHSKKTNYEERLENRKINIVSQGYAILLDKVLPCMPKKIRLDFPILQKIDFESGDYNGEDLILTPKETNTLKEELDRIRRIYNYEEFVEELDSNSFKKFLEEQFLLNNLEEEIYNTSNLVNLAAQNKYWIRITR